MFQVFNTSSNRVFATYATIEEAQAHVKATLRAVPSLARFVEVRVAA